MKPLQQTKPERHLPAFLQYTIPSLVLLLFCVRVHAQLPLATVVSLALSNSPRVKLAEDDLRHARAVVSETKDVFIPTIIANGGAGDSYGITLNVPTILTVNTQSLIYSSSQRLYVRASRASLQAASLALEDVRQRVEEETILTYLNLDHAGQVADTLRAEFADTTQLEAIVQKRFDAGLETQLEVNQVRRDVLGLQLQQMQTEDERAALQEHLGSATGLAPASLIVVPESISAILAIPTANSRNTSSTFSTSERAANANAQARVLHAQGDNRYQWRPQVGFAAQYGRVSPINDVSDYYNLHGKYNVGFIGIQIQLPLLDAAHRSRGEEAKADASHAQHDLTQLRAQENEDHLRLLHSVSELAIRAQIAELDLAIAEDQLKSITVQVTEGGNGGPVLNPRDEQSARIRVRQRHLDLLDARLQVQRAQVSLLRMTGSLHAWLAFSTQQQPSAFH